ncbi:hypothetical protein P168DRAFT_302232 [Aspergillus campestris IBT 28561]|uniref:VASt domain-containing protein n=1 Tax=Aspergillus campestris (strain IBT 28561) TaxID=1392248 RepID=A0A2I1DBM9_ASPC2|nr:uncharacterized protein P168DRAFT_302232 [Aspergillus campestris IBT 28561]PKY07271.1 hypothetical protein P168DRAFT_302232 [Aspergillus campestris IBT 28561]
MDQSSFPEPPPVPESDQGFTRPLRSSTTAADLETTASHSTRRSSVESVSERPKSQPGEHSDSAKAGSSGFSKLLASRRKRKQEKESRKQAELATQHERDDEEDPDDRRLGSRSGLSTASSTNDTESYPEREPTNIILTDDSEPDRTPPLTTRNSHTGFYTTSSPLLASGASAETDGAQADVESAVSGPSGGAASEATVDHDTSRPSSRHASTLGVPPDSAKKRAVSPGRRFKNPFGADKEKKSSTRDRASSTASVDSKRSRKGSMSSRKAPVVVAEDPPPLPPIRTELLEEKPLPPTTVTPPSPLPGQHNLFSSPDVVASPESMDSKKTFHPGVVVSPSGNMISHRRVRSASAAGHKPSRLSNSISAIGPPLEETKANPVAQQSGFFSSVFSVAQNAASTLSSSLNAQQKPRSPAQPMTAESDVTASDGADGSSPAPEEQKKPLAIDTLGSGDLNFDHLDIAIPPGGSVSTPDGVVITKPQAPPEKRRTPAVYRQDEEAAKAEGRRAARAVTMAYEKPADISVRPPSGESVEQRSTASLPRDPSGDSTPPNGSLLDGETDAAQRNRSSSVQSRLVPRRHRGSSAATASTIGAAAAGASLALGIPGGNSSVPRLTGFAVASKKRNRDFHQLFRSVPEDDYLIEDYSCALQREIILAGRIYISEGHICFSSNILGWVTTLVISFDEVVAIEKESTAMVFPNAIAIQTLHARHTFRSLLSRESTYDLMVNIWKINHPTVKSSVNGTRVAHGTGDKTEKAGESDDSDAEDEIYDEDEEGDNADSFFEPGDDSVAGSERSAPTKSLSRQASSGALQTANGAGAATSGNANGASKGTAGDGDADFPGPPTHAPTEYTDPAGQYEKVVKDEIIPAPLGKVYSYVFGPASGAFVPKFLVENQKSGELQFESEKKGLTNDSRTRKYSYIKPLGGAPIGPKQTKCISTEYLDFLDLEKAVLVTLTTQTPDVPSGNVFSTKTKYLFTWAAGNQTRFLMSCTIEWTGKSWLKGPIEKGAMDGQTAFGTDLVNALKAAVAPRARTTGKGKGRRKKTDIAREEAAAAVAAAKAVSETTARENESWGFLEPLHGLLGPVGDIIKPLCTGNVAIVVIGLLLVMLFFRSPSKPPSILSHDIGCPGYSLPQRLAAYEEMWRREESELWSWLEDRVGMDGMAFPNVHKPFEMHSRRGSRRTPGEREVHERLGEDKMSDREMDHAIRTTRERLDTLERILTQRRSPSEAEASHLEL